MKYLLDTNICIYIINKKPANVLKKFYDHDFGDLCVSTITTAELYCGVCKSQKATQNIAALSEFLLNLSVLPFSNEASVAYGKIRSSLTKSGKIMGDLDLLIAAQALSLKIPVITNNTEEFNRVEGLSVINWV